MNDKKSKIERWRNQTLVNRTNNDSSIATEYFTMVEYIVDNYEQRFETIQNPILHLMSHCLELRYKDTILYAADYYLKDATLKESIIHEHDLQKLCAKFVELCNLLLNELRVADDDKDIIEQKIIPQNEKITTILKSNVTSYRYSKEISRKGNVKGPRCPITTDEESPNILEVYALLKDCNINIVYVAHLLDLFVTD